jgi:hypothetical protein
MFIKYKKAAVSVSNGSELVKRLENSKFEISAMIGTLVKI